MKKLLIASSIALLLVSFQSGAASLPANTLDLSIQNTGGAPMTLIFATSDEQVSGGGQVPKNSTLTQDWGIALGARDDRRIANYSSFAGNNGKITAVSLYSDTTFGTKIADAVFKASNSNWVLRSTLAAVDHVYGLRVESVREANSTSGSYSTNVSTVPVPGAVWLFGSGIAGLIGLSRRKSKTLTTS